MGGIIVDLSLKKDVDMGKGDPKNDDGDFGNILLVIFKKSG